MKHWRGENIVIVHRFAKVLPSKHCQCNRTLKFSLPNTWDSKIQILCTQKPTLEQNFFGLQISTVIIMIYLC